ncbi:MAG: signal peptidase II [Verrucomicrobiota bacterium]
MPFRKGLLIISLPLYLLDQVTKWLIVLNFKEPNPPMGFFDFKTVIPGFFDIVRVHNTGIAFGRFNGGEHSNLIFSIISIAAVGFLTYLWKSDAFSTKPSRLAAFLLLPGIFGNLTDRFVHGYVVDFLHFDLQFMIWPSFNVADACICVAAGLLFISALIEGRAEAKKTSPSE